ncbi:FUSC family protein [Cohnella zeiphila]|uniref:FUSC family protein n=1 Tax=Cohnella zeiphila TaxID=2761120 RepID=A0A7X0SHI8_9BACL|nr:aromatic acid exporter family protein [Cohnella zeiphila]MBB6730078.1 FUSC family protein [Cohnella zeiphila]
MIIGARVFKTGLAVAVALWVGEWLGIDSPLLAAITAIFTVQPSIHRSWRQVLDQLQSNVLGAAVALLAFWLLGSTPISVGLVCILVILLCLKLKIEDTIGLTLVTVVVIMEARSQGWPAALDRLIGLLVGFASAFAVNLAIAPPKHRGRFVRLVQEAQSLLSRLLRTSVSNELKENVFHQERDQLQTLLKKLDEQYRMFAEERVWFPRSRTRQTRLLVVYKEMLQALQRGENLVEAVDEQYWAVSSEADWNRDADRHLEALSGYHEQLLWKWEGKMKAGAAAAAPPIEEGVRLTERIIASSESNAVKRARLLVITSAMFAYEDRLRRLDRLMEHWLERETGGVPEEEKSSPAQP